MSEEKRPAVWKMVREAIEALGGKTTNVALRDWIQSKYPGTKPVVIRCATIESTVNHASRIHYGGAAKPRVATGPHDFLFQPGKHQLELYNPEIHGQWEIYKKDNGSLGVRQVGNAGEEEEDGGVTKGEGGGGFAAEDHFRDYLVRHLDQIENGLTLYVDENENSGVEYVTPVGRIDILAVDGKGEFVVVELKISDNADSVSGQVLRYKNWVAKHLADGKPVRGIVIAPSINDKIRYAIANDPQISTKEYEISLVLRDVPRI